MCVAGTIVAAHTPTHTLTCTCPTRTCILLCLRRCASPRAVPRPSAHTPDWLLAAAGCLLRRPLLRRRVQAPVTIHPLSEKRRREFFASGPSTMLTSVKFDASPAPRQASSSGSPASATSFPPIRDRPASVASKQLVLRDDDGERELWDRPPSSTSAHAASTLTTLDKIRCVSVHFHPFIRLCVRVDMSVSVGVDIGGVLRCTSRCPLLTRGWL